LHIKNPVGDFSPTGFVEQPKKVKQKKTSHSSKRTSSHIWLLVLGNFETLGSKFRRHETKGLLPSFATIIEKSVYIS